MLGGRLSVGFGLCSLLSAALGLRLGLGSALLLHCTVASNALLFLVANGHDAGFFRSLRSFTSHRANGAGPLLAVVVIFGLGEVGLCLRKDRGGVLFGSGLAGYADGIAGLKQVER